MQKDVVIIGAGPAGIFTALEMLKKGSRQKILIVEKGRAVEERRCPKGKAGKCVNCKPYCHITTGFSGAGAFSDGKLSLSYEVGGDLPTLIGADKAQETQSAPRRPVAMTVRPERISSSSFPLVICTPRQTAPSRIRLVHS